MAYRVGIAGAEALNWTKLKAKILNSFRVSRGLSRLLSRGEPLNEMTRMEMESALGYELRDVRVHQTKQAGELASELQAEAFTIGADVFTGEGRFNLPSRENRGLIAHELTHVIQQSHPSPIPRSSDNLSNDGPPHAVMQLAPIGAFQSGVSSTVGEMEAVAQTVEQAVHREEEDNTRDQTPTVDAEEIAEIVYRLMQQELLLEGDRVRR